MTDNAFKTVQGVKVTDLTGINEYYNVKKFDLYHVITINVSAENIINMVEKLTSIIKKTGLFTIEIPTNEKDEKEIREKDTDPFHQDIYYLEDITQVEFLKIFHTYKNLFINDGFINFSFASSEGIDEIMIKEYKIFYVITDEPELYEQILKENNYSKQDRIKTVWDTFTEETPGSIAALTLDGHDMYDVIENLKKDGLYLAKRIEK